MSAKARTDLLTTVEMHKLDEACRILDRAFPNGDTFLVGSAGVQNLVDDPGANTYRDVDVRLMLDDAEFAAICPTLARWELLCLAISAYLAERTGLPIDFQIQSASVANDRFGGKFRNPLGMGRTFAGGGDATPEWGAVPSQ